MRSVATTLPIAFPAVLVVAPHVRRVVNYLTTVRADPTGNPTLGGKTHFMKRTTLFILLLVAALVATNTLWVYRTLDLGVTLTYQDASLEEIQPALSQAFAIIKAPGNQSVSRLQIVEAAQRAGSRGSDSIETPR